jgi:hypothetical protein
MTSRTTLPPATSTEFSSAEGRFEPVQASSKFSNVGFVVGMSAEDRSLAGRMERFTSTYTGNMAASPSRIITPSRTPVRHVYRFTVHPSAGD